MRSAQQRNDGAGKAVFEVARGELAECSTVSNFLADHPGGDIVLNFDAKSVAMYLFKLGSSSEELFNRAAVASSFTERLRSVN